MSTYLKRLGAKVGGAFIASLTGLALADAPFNAITFDWATALTVSGSAAVLTLLQGLTARFVGDPERPNLTP